jgi:hypothetical protein
MFAAKYYFIEVLNRINIIFGVYNLREIIYRNIHQLEGCFVHYREQIGQALHLFETTPVDVWCVLTPKQRKEF